MNELIERDPNKRGGILCISGTRLPLYHLWDHINHGWTAEMYASTYDVPLSKVRPIVNFLQSKDDST